jgi:hypothetical protein
MNSDAVCSMLASRDLGIRWWFRLALAVTRHSWTKWSHRLLRIRTPLSIICILSGLRSDRQFGNPSASLSALLQNQPRDEAIDYKGGALAVALAQACPRGIDVYCGANVRS